ncbi:MAG: hypothetical protein R3E95_22805 [Thiolinea sp.]
MNELEIQPPASDEAIEQAQQTLIDRNDLQEGLIYLQVTRGSADRDFAYPARWYAVHPGDVHPEQEPAEQPAGGQWHQR